MVQAAPRCSNRVFPWQPGPLPALSLSDPPPAGNRGTSEAHRPPWPAARGLWLLQEPCPAGLHVSRMCSVARLFALSVPFLHAPSPSPGCDLLGADFTLMSARGLRVYLELRLQTPPLDFRPSQPPASPLHQLAGQRLAPAFQKSSVISPDSFIHCDF